MLNKAFEWTTLRANKRPEARELEKRKPYREYSYLAATGDLIQARDRTFLFYFSVFS